MGEYIAIEAKELSLNDHILKPDQIQTSLKEHLNINSISDDKIEVSININYILFSAIINKCSECNESLGYNLLLKIKNKSHADYDFDVKNHQLNIYYIFNDQKYKWSVQLVTQHYYDQHASLPIIIDSIKYQLSDNYIDIKLSIKDSLYEGKSDGTLKCLKNEYLYGRIYERQVDLKLLKSLLKNIKEGKHEDYLLICKRPNWHFLIKYNVMGTRNEIKISLSSAEPIYTTIDCVIL